MDNGRRLSGDDVCDVVCPKGSPPECPKEACHKAIQMFRKDIGPPEPVKPPATPKKGKRCDK
jgi:hypothetical protein